MLYHEKLPWSLEMSILWIWPRLYVVQVDRWSVLMQIRTHILVYFMQENCFFLLCLCTEHRSGSLLLMIKELVKWVLSGKHLDSENRSLTFQCNIVQNCVCMFRYCLDRREWRPEGTKEKSLLIRYSEKFSKVIIPFIKPSDFSFTFSMEKSTVKKKKPTRFYVQYFSARTLLGPIFSVQFQRTYRPLSLGTTRWMHYLVSRSAWAVCWFPTEWLQWQAPLICLDEGESFCR